MNALFQRHAGGPCHDVDIGAVADMGRRPMTTLSAGAAAGLLVALMVVATGDSRAAEAMPSAQLDSPTAQPTFTRTVYQLRATSSSLGKVDAGTGHAART